MEKRSKCMTEGSDPWTLSITPDSTGVEVDDGELEVGPEDARTGEFDGWHNTQGGDRIRVRGKCTGKADEECTEDKPCHIHFRKEQLDANDGKTYVWRYDADFTGSESSGYDTVPGTTRFTKKLKDNHDERKEERKEEKILGEDEGTWVGTKPPT
jgi:hypothetical protein